MQRFHFSYLLIACLLWLATAPAWAQKPLNPVKDTGPKSKVELLPGSDSLVALNNDFSIIKVFGNVRFSHQGAILACRLAVQNSNANTVEAFGSVRITQGDTLTITGDTLFYDGYTRFARVSGRKVTLRDKKIFLETTRLNYDMNSGDAFYNTRGRITEDSSVLQSDKGVYNTRSKIFNYDGNVQIDHPRYKLVTDKLVYDTNTGLATFATPTTITSKDGTIKALSGTYNTRTQEAQFSGRSQIANDDYTLEADTLLFNRANDYGTATGRVIFFSKADKITLYGKKAFRNGSIGLTKIMGESLLAAVDQKDTLFMRSDTLYTYEYLKDELPADSISKAAAATPASVPAKPGAKATPTQKTAPPPAAKREKKLKLFVADGRVKVYRTDIQSTCDSLRYDLKDSAITFFKSPLIWATDSQFKADTIRAGLRQNRVRNVWMTSKSFVIAEDTVGNFNQLKGRQIHAAFTDSSTIHRITVEGNGESIYFVLDEKNKLIGVNNVTCSRMAIQFKARKVKRISFVGNPEAVLYPPKDVDNARQRLENFEWKADQKPTRTQVVGTFATEVAPKPKPPAAAVPVVPAPPALPPKPAKKPKQSKG